MHALLTTTVHSQNRPLQASCVLAAVVHSPESIHIAAQHACIAYNHSTLSKQVTASLMCIGCCRAFTRIDPRCCTACMHCLQPLYTVKTGQCKPDVYWLLSRIHQNRPPGRLHCCTACMHCLQPLYTVKTGHCKPHVCWLLCMHQLILLQTAHNRCTLSKQDSASHMCTKMLCRQKL